MSLNQDSLFLKLPAPQKLAEKGASSSVDQLLHDLKNKVEYSALIDTCYFLLKDGDLSYEESLKVWEIRLILHIFDGGISIAKKEGINLNNELYLIENKSREPPAAPQAPGVPSSRTGSLTNASATGNEATLPIYPLPRNNNSQISHSLLILLLRLKSIPNLNLVNELYKLTYQSRLKASSNSKEPEVISLQLANLSYDIIVVLTITKNYLTLVNFIQSIRYELDIGSAYSSRLALLWLIIKLILHVKKYASTTAGNTDSLTDALVQQYQKDFNGISKSTLSEFQYILNNFNPNLSVGSVNDGVNEITLELLVSRAQKGLISGRIICCTLGLWNLQNRFGVELRDGELVFEKKAKENKEEGTEGTERAKTVEECYSEVTHRWLGNINRVYCLE
ncbi:hypothetical protein CLIB1423_23S01332 [[Candida] railenensis]|uniref:Uncharacterized protein n=1 Tax=[Candida] railenensis TaxID=45579 RepID=A0A9P0W0P9_9ASCO|nr:hypothetical protein CLIB1423_23S01332 [[Candida] railenensis]